MLITYTGFHGTFRDVRSIRHREAFDDIDRGRIGTLVEQWFSRKSK